MNQRPRDIYTSKIFSGGLKLWQKKAKTEKQKGALNSYFNKTASENAQEVLEKPHHSEDGNNVDN